MAQKSVFGPFSYFSAIFPVLLGRGQNRFFGESPRHAYSQPQRTLSVISSLEHHPALRGGKHLLQPAQKARLAQPRASKTLLKMLTASSEHQPHFSQHRLHDGPVLASTKRPFLVVRLSETQIKQIIIRLHVHSLCIAVCMPTIEVWWW